MGWLHDEDEYLPGNWEGPVGQTDLQRAVSALEDAAILCLPADGYDRRPRTSEAAVAAYQKVVAEAATEAYAAAFPQEVYERCASVAEEVAAAYGAAKVAEAAIELGWSEARGKFFYAPGTRREKALAPKPWRIGLATQLLRQCAEANAAYRRVAALCAGVPTDIESVVDPDSAAEKVGRAVAIKACAEWLTRYVPAAKGCPPEVVHGAARALESLGGATYRAEKTKAAEYATIQRVAKMAREASAGSRKASNIIEVIRKWKEATMP